MIKLLDIVNEILDGEDSFNPKIVSDKIEYERKLNALITHLKTKNKVLLLTCSNRTNNIQGVVNETPKSTALAYKIKDLLSKDTQVELIEVPELKILPCEGNVSRYDGNSCGVPRSVLKNKSQNPSGYHRCWASLNNKDDELWRVSKELFESDAVIFFASVRWGQTNMFYQKLIERLNWIENRHTTLNEDNVIKNIHSGFICTGQNWNGENVLETQKKVHKFYGFKINKDLFWNWQYTQDYNDETAESYKKSFGKFEEDFNL